MQTFLSEKWPVRARNRDSDSDVPELCDFHRRVTDKNLSHFKNPAVPAIWNPAVGWAFQDPARGCRKPTPTEAAAAAGAAGRPGGPGPDRCRARWFGRAFASGRRGLVK